MIIKKTVSIILILLLTSCAHMRKYDGIDYGLNTVYLVTSIIDYNQTLEILDDGHIREVNKTIDTDDAALIVIFGGYIAVTFASLFMPSDLRKTWLSIFTGHKIAVVQNNENVLQ